MDSIIKNITKIANKLDSKGNSGTADSLDLVAKNLVNIKTAQYVGSQGYWIRNSRCWGNCYRQKRANNPEMPAQKVWESCHDEYVDSINNTNQGKSNASWDKYASSKEDKISDFDIAFAKTIESHIDSGMERGHAIFAAIDEMNMRPYDQLIEASEQTFTLASSLFESDPQSAVKIASVGEELVKEAQWWKRRMQDMSQPGKALKQKWNPAVIDSGSQVEMNNSINRLTQAIGTAFEEKANLINMAQKAGLNDFANQIDSNLPQSTFEQLTNGVTSVNNFAGQINNRETGGEKGNAIQRGLNWANEQQQQGAEKAQNSRDFWGQQSGQGIGQQPVTAPSNISGPNDPMSGEIYQQQPEQNQAYNGTLEAHPPSIINEIRRRATDKASLDAMFKHLLNDTRSSQQTVQQGNSFVQDRNEQALDESYAGSTSEGNKMDKIAMDPQNNEGQPQQTVEEYLNGLKAMGKTIDIQAIYEEMSKEIELRTNNQSFSGDIAGASYAHVSSGKKIANKKFNLSKVLDGGVKK